MRLPTRHQWLVAAVGVFLAVGLVLTSIWLVVRHDAGEGTAPPPAGAPATTSSSVSPDTPPSTAPATMMVKVYFHRGQRDDPTKVVAVRRSVPLTITGRALAFEDTVNVRVVQIKSGVVRHLGSGHVTGGGDVMRPFTGQITFAAPSTDAGWVLASELSAYNGAVTKVTAVRVAFTDLPG